MYQIINWLFVCLITVSLTGCGPIYKIEHSYVPPVSSTGKMCIAQCVQNKNTCQQMCQMRKDNCRSQARQDAYYQYESYKNDQARLGKPIEKSIRDFDHSFFECRKPCHCDQTFNSCYSACGGEVLSRQVCVAFCDKH